MTNKNKLKIKARLIRYTHTNQEAIQVIHPNGDKSDLWKSVIEFCAKVYSDNELKKIWSDCQGQIYALNPEDVPLIFKEMMQELKIAIKNRNINIEEVAPSKEEKPYWLKQ